MVVASKERQENMSVLRYVVALLAVVAMACGPIPVPQPPDPPPQVQVAALAVVVSDAATGARLQGASVRVHTGETGTTDAEGYVEWKELPLGERGIDVSLDGYDSAFAEARPFDSNTQVRVTLKKVPLPPEPEPSPTPTPEHPSPLVGHLRILSGCFADDTGCVLPMYAHAGDFFSAYVRNRTRVQQQLDALAQAGYHGIRFWTVLGCGAWQSPCPSGTYWVGREVGPEVTPEFEGQLEAFTRELVVRKLRGVVSQGDIGQVRDRRSLMSTLARVEARVGVPVFDWVDCGNEAWQTGEPSPSALAQCVGYYRQAGGKALLTLTSPPSEEKVDLDAFSIDPAQAFDVHSYRGGHWYDKRRHIFSIRYEGNPMRAFGIGSEPPGNGELVSASSNKEELDGEAVAALGVTSALARQAWVWFSGEGVKLNRGLENESGFVETPRAYRWLPKDVASFGTLHHSGDSWRGTRIVAIEGETRVDGRLSSDGRFVYTIDGPSGTHHLRVERGFTAQLCNPGTGACETVTRKAGETLDVALNRARILVGRLQ